MNGPCDLTSWRLDASDLAVAFEWTRHLDTQGISVGSFHRFA